MQLARVLGTATATVKHKSMNGFKLLVVKLLMADRSTADGDPVLAVDRIGAGAGEIVMITSDGKVVRELTSDETTPIRWSVLGIQDEQAGDR